MHCNCDVMGFGSYLNINGYGDMLTDLASQLQPGQSKGIAIPLPITPIKIPPIDPSLRPRVAPPFTSREYLSLQQKYYDFWNVRDGFGRIPQDRITQVVNDYHNYPEIMKSRIMQIIQPAINISIAMEQLSKRIH